FAASDGAGADRIVGVELPVGRGIAGFVAMSGQAMAVADVQQDPRFARDIAESTEFVPQTLVAAPIISPDGEIAGVLSVLDPAVDATSGWSLSVLGTFGTLVGQLLAARGGGARAAESSDDQSELGGLTTRLVTRGPAGERLARDVLTSVSRFLDEGTR